MVSVYLILCKIIDFNKLTFLFFANQRKQKNITKTVIASFNLFYLNIEHMFKLLELLSA